MVRIERSIDAFGTLNILPKNNITWGDVQEAGRKAEEKLNENLSSLLYTVGKERTTRASRKITDAVQHLRTERRRETLIRELDEEPTTCELDIPIDVETLKEFIAHPMSLAHKTNGNKVNAGQNYRTLASQLLKKIEKDTTKRIDDEGITWITIKYKHCKIGQRLNPSMHLRRQADGATELR